MAGGTHTFLFTDLVGFTALTASGATTAPPTSPSSSPSASQPLAGEHGAEEVKRSATG